MNLFDRYITRNFLQAYLYCIIGFISIWFIFDISDSISTFLDQHVGFGRVLEYYGTQIPQILVILLPVSLLLALLFVLGRMSRANEIVSMLTAGIGLIRVLTPLFLLAVLTTAICFALNYSLAPHAEMARKLFFADKSATGAEGQIFRNRRDSRTWFIQRLRHNSDVFDNVEVLQQDSSDHITMAFLAARAPFRTHYHYRIALPWTCFVVTLIAAPLGVGFSRRGVLTSVATAILLIFALNFSTHLFLALGEGDRVPPWMAGWAPTIVFGTIGLYLLQLRSSNRDPSDFRGLLPRRIFAR